MSSEQIVPIEIIDSRILFIRGQKVLLDKDLAKLYNVATRDLNKAVSRNISRFPVDFMFQLSREEFNNLKFQFGTSNKERDERRYLPFAFTEQVALMAAFVNAVVVNQKKDGILSWGRQCRK